MTPIDRSVMNRGFLKVSSNSVFALLLVYYWLLLFFLRADKSFERFSVMYYLFTVPIGLYVLLNLKWLLARYQPGAKILLSYALLAGIVSVVRLDLNTLISVGLFAAVLIIVLNASITVDIRLVNALFLLSIVGSAITYYAGTNVWGFLPGQSTEVEVWRVSLFPLRVESAYFSTIVLLMSAFHNRARSRYVFMSLALYFLLLSGLRSAVLALLAMLLFLAFSRVWRMRGGVGYKVLFALAVILLILVVNAGVLLPWGLDFGNEFLNAYVLHLSGGASLSQEDIVATMYRSWLWQQHLTMFSQHPFFGVGTFDFRDVENWELMLGGAGSESFVTSLLARIGLLALPLFVFFYQVLQIAVDAGDRYLYCLCLLFAFAALSYGSFIVPYNFVFLLMAAQLNHVNGAAGAVTRPLFPKLAVA